MEDGSKFSVNEAVIVPRSWALTVEFKFTGRAISIPGVALQASKVQFLAPDTPIEKTAPAGSHDVPIGVVTPHFVGLAAIAMENSC